MEIEQFARLSLEERTNLVRWWDRCDADEVTLTDLGQRHANVIAFRGMPRYLREIGADPVAIYCSKYRRTGQTADPLRERFPQLPFILDSRLREIPDGRMEYDYADYCQYFPDYAASVERDGYMNARPFAGESPAGARDGRVRALLHELAQEGTDNLIVTHAGFISAVRQIVYQESDEEVKERHFDLMRRNPPYGSVLVVRTTLSGLQPIALDHVLCEPPTARPA